MYNNITYSNLTSFSNPKRETINWNKTLSETYKNVIFEFVKNAVEQTAEQTIKQYFEDSLKMEDESIVTINQNETDKWDEFRKLLMSSVDLKKISYGESCVTEDIISDLSEEENMDDIMKWLYDMVLENTSNADLICNILHAISHLDYKKVYPFGPMLAIAMFSNDVMIIQEYAVKAFINWNNKDTLKYSNLSPKSKILEQRWKRAIEYIDKFGEDENEETYENDWTSQFMGA